MKKHIPLILALGLLTNYLGAEESYSAKSLFFGEDASSVTNSPKLNNSTEPTKNKVTSTKAKKTLGTNHFINLKKQDGSYERVLTSRVFRSGEQFKLGIQVKEPSYVYVYNTAPNGKRSLIYPSKGENSFISAKGTLILPAHGNFAFDHEPGKEELEIYVAEKPIKKPMQVIEKSKPDITVSSDQVCLDDKTVAGINIDTSRTNNVDNMVASNDYASKGIVLAEDKSAICKTTGGSNEFASKGIFFAEDDSQTDTAGNLQPAGYVIKTVDKKSNGHMHVKITLKHQ